MPPSCCCFLYSQQDPTLDPLQVRCLRLGCLRLGLVPYRSLHCNSDTNHCIISSPNHCNRHMLLSNFPYTIIKLNIVPYTSQVDQVPYTILKSIKSDTLVRARQVRVSTYPPPRAPTQTVPSSMQLTLHTTRRTLMSAWSVKTRRAPSRHCRDARVYGHTTTAMPDMTTPPCLPHPHPVVFTAWLSFDEIWLIVHTNYLYSYSKSGLRFRADAAHVFGDKLLEIGVWPIYTGHLE